MKTFLYTVKNIDRWAITDAIMVVIARDEEHCKEILLNNVDKTAQFNQLNQGIITELTEGFHNIQDMITE